MPSAASWGPRSTCSRSAGAICARQARRSEQRPSTARRSRWIEANAMIEFLRGYALGVGEILLIFAGFAVIERLRPAERGQPLRASLFNVRYLVVYQLI